MMSWGTDFKANLYICNEVFNSEYELDDRIKEWKHLKKLYEDDIKALAYCTPRDICPVDEEQTPLEYISFKLRESFEELEEVNYKIFMLEILKDNWSTKEDNI